MSTIVDRFNKIKSKIKEIDENQTSKIVAISKTFSLDHIKPLIDYGHIHFGENKVQEAEVKWKEIKKKYDNLKLHMVGKLQSNKAKKAVEIFDYIHSLDNLKLANKISNELQKKAKEIKIFIQVNLGGETQKSGIHPSDLKSFYKQCVELNLNIIGTMCIPPDNQDPKPFFKDLLALNREINLSEISMGMTNDYLDALEYRSTFLRIGTGIFGQRTK
jgi:hypothetical protein